MFKNPRRGRQARSFTINVPKILDLKSSSEQIFSENLKLGAPAFWNPEYTELKSPVNLVCGIRDPRPATCFYLFIYLFLLLYFSSSERLNRLYFPRPRICLKRYSLVIMAAIDRLL